MEKHSPKTAMRDIYSDKTSCGGITPRRCIATSQRRHGRLSTLDLNAPGSVAACRALINAFDNLSRMSWFALFTFAMAAVPLWRRHTDARSPPRVVSANDGGLDACAHDAPL